LDPCGLVEETLAAIADYPDKAIFIEVTAARAQGGGGIARSAAGRASAQRSRTRTDGLEGSVRCSGPGDHGRIGRVEIGAPAKRDAALLRAAVDAPRQHD
jgi:hypothetical protein